MKPKDYRKTFNLETSVRFDRSTFCTQLMEDFIVSLEQHPKMNVAHFRNEVSNLKQKFEYIFNGTPFAYEAQQKFWNYIFAVKIIPIRNTYFIDWNKSTLEHRVATDPDFAHRYTTC